MKYILKIYYRSKYIGYQKVEYKEFESYIDTIRYLSNRECIKYELYIKCE